MRGGRIYVATREIKDAEFNLGVAQSQLQAEILRVTADVKQAYYNTIFSARVIQVSQEAIERSRLLVEASEALFSAGRANQRDVVSAQIRLSDDLSDLVRRQALLERSQLVLRDVTGLPIREPLALASDTIPFYPIKIQQAQWIERAIANRPEIQGVLYRLDQSALNVRVASNSVLPKLDVVGLFRRSDFDRSYQNVWGFDSQRFIGGLEFEIPFGNVAARERLRSAKIVHQRVERELVNTRRLIELEVRGEVISLRENLEDLEAQTAKVQQARQKLEIATVRYQRGLANNLDITDAQEDLVDAETDFLANIVDYTNGLARLEARIAGPL
jgi:outer membrane protein TolC